MKKILPILLGLVIFLNCLILPLSARAAPADTTNSSTTTTTNTTTGTGSTTTGSTGTSTSTGGSTTTSNTTTGTGSTTTGSTTAPADTTTAANDNGAGAAPAVGTTTDTANGQWVPDDETTFVGKTASRANDFLDWTLKNYQWLCVQANPASTYLCNNANDPLIPFWVIIRNIVYAFLAIFVLVTAFILIITRGQNITIMRFVPRFIFIVLLITFSFSLVQFIYVICDIIQDFFLKVGGQYITSHQLLYIGFDYQSFVGIRKHGPQFDESAFITLLLVRLTAITYYVMTGILLIRKIILWFFIIISPIFPLLLFYKPIRNTAKIWIGEFFRWLLYAPLFAVFLHGLVVVWQKGIPLLFEFNKAGQVAGTDVIYPTAVDILLAGPGQSISMSNSVNLSSTFADYVVALLMLWVVIILPFLLLKIFLDYLSTLSFDNNMMFKNFMNKGASFFGGKGAPPSPPPLPGQNEPAGMARALPFLSAKQAIPVQFQASVQASVKESADVMRMTNLSIPRMRDIAQYETSMMGRGVPAQATSFNSTLKKIANPASVASVAEREKFTTVRQKLLEQKQKGNPIATSILNASQVTNETTTSSPSQNLASSILSMSQISTATTSATKNVVVHQQQLKQMSLALAKLNDPNKATAPGEKEQYQKIKERLMQEKAKGNDVAASILDAEVQLNGPISDEQKSQVATQLLDKLLVEEQKGKVVTRAAGPISPAAPQILEKLPIVNKVQQVSLEDYEEVRKLWSENYQKLEPPKALNGEQVNRSEWIKNDIDKINQAIALLSSVEPNRIDEGMSMVSTILPFLLIGGFSKSEVVAYLKAKLEAGKQVLADMSRKEQEEEGMVGAQTKKAAQPKEIADVVEAKIPTEPKVLPENPAVSDTKNEKKVE